MSGLAEVVRQAEVLRHIIALLEKEFGCKVYSDEVLEKFSRPCFFIGASSVMTPRSVNWMQKELTIVLTFYARSSEKNEIVYMDVVDRVQLLFQVGVQVNDRYLKVDSIEDDRVGEESDILQLTIVIPYLERVVSDADTGFEMMEEVNMEIRHDGGRNSEEVFVDVIDKDTV